MTPTSGAHGTLSVRDLNRQFGSHHAVRGVSFDIRRTEFVTLLGPSGSGKTTTLRMIAGFTAPTSGTILIDGADVTALAPERREIGMVFQNYALFPHMTAAQNLAFPLEMRGVARHEVKQRVNEALALVRLDSLGERYPRQLSGGQQQRVALARAIVFRPRLLLLDEPLGALDRKLREALQVEILGIRRRLGMTIVYVTHDQDEALSMSDRIAVFNEGRIEQIGSARDLYDHPASLFVATFLGEATIVRGTLERDSAGLVLKGDAGTVAVSQSSVDAETVGVGSQSAISIRPEHAWVSIVAEPGAQSVPATIEEILYLGSTTKVVLRLRDGSRGVVRENAHASTADRSPGTEAHLCWKAEAQVIVPISAP